MNTQASNEGDCSYKTANRELVLFLKIKGVNPTGFETVGKRKLFTYNRTAISEHGLDKIWQSGDQIMVDIRSVFLAESWFNSMVHDEL